MIISLALVLLATAAATLTTYLFDQRAVFAARVCAGACIGMAALGLICFLFASFLGLTPVAIMLTALVLLIPFLLLLKANLKESLVKDLIETSRALGLGLRHPEESLVGYAGFYIFAAAVLWACFLRAMIELPDGVYTGVLNNFGDLPFHISVVTSFAFGNNYPPEDPTYAGVKFTYPFLTDFVSAIFVNCGASLRQAMFIENFVVGLAFVGLLHRWALALLRDKLAALITPLIVILNGGFGWIFLLRSARENHESLNAFLRSLPVSFTVIPETTWRWGNSVSTLLIPQRGFLLGLPLAVIVFTQWWLATAEPEDDAHPERLKKRGKTTKAKKQSAEAPLLKSRSSINRMIAAGIVAGLLPLIHAHSFVAVMAVGAGIALLQRRWREWFTFFAVASVIALPQMFWSTHNSAVDAAKFFEWHFGWDRGKDNAIWFWFKNTGLFIPLLIASLFWRNTKPLVSRPLMFFYLPFTLCFIVPNVLKMAPWIWDNIKVLYYWWLASAPLVALLLSHLWKQGGVRRVCATALFALVIFAGSLDVASILLRPSRHQVFDSSGIRFAELIKLRTQPDVLIMHAPVHNHPVFLTGRRSLMGYPGHIWTHGLDYHQRESEIKRVFAGAPDAVNILQRYNVSYVVVGPHERNIMRVNDQFFSRFESMGDVGGYFLYKVGRP